MIPRLDLLLDCLRFYPLILLLYLITARLCFSIREERWKPAAFAVVNIIGSLYLSYGIAYSVYGNQVPYGALFRFISFIFAIYLALIILTYVFLYRSAGRNAGFYWTAFFLPLIFMALVKIFSGNPDMLALSPAGLPGVSLAAMFVGISYMAFRLSFLAIEVRNGQVALPGIWDYLSFALFAPTFIVGPISPYRAFADTLYKKDPDKTPTARAWMRILTGIIKFQFLANIFNQLSFDGLILDGLRHPPVDLALASVSYYFYLYCNFSGFCDMAIGAAGVLGIQVRENFNNPFAARSVRDFWNRWHITLSEYMQIVVFAPMSKYLAGILKPGNINQAIALSIIAVFLLIGIWHGFGWNYLLFGAAHALGVVVNHYYGVVLKKFLGEKIRLYNRSRLIKVCAMLLTFSYVTASFFIFANSIDQMRAVWQAINWSS